MRIARAAPRQVDEKRVLHHFDLDARIAAREVGQRLRQQVLHHDERGGHAQRAGQLAVSAEHPALDLVGLVGHAPRLLQQHQPGLGGLVAAALALEEARAEARFQRIEPAQHGAVVHAQLARGACQRAGVADRQRMAQIAPVEFGHGAQYRGAVRFCKLGLHIGPLLA